MQPLIESLIESLRASLGDDAVLTGAAVSERLAGIWRNDFVVAPAIVRPASTQQVAEVLRACNAARQPVVLHGGLTGLVEGAGSVWHVVVPGGTLATEVTIVTGITFANGVSRGVVALAVLTAGIHGRAFLIRIRIGIGVRVGIRVGIRIAAISGVRHKGGA